MKNKFIICTLLIVTIFFVAGCDKKENDFKLQIKESSWSGWSEGYEPEEVTNDYDIVLGEEYNIDDGNFIFKITKINNDSIIIETKDAFSDKENGIDLSTTKKEFEVFFDKEITLKTPTMDAGDIYYLKLVK